MQYFQFVATNAATGAALPGASVAVYLTGTTTPASLYNSGGSAIANPVTASGTGAVGFQAANGTYDIAITSGAYTAPTIVGVQLFDLSHMLPNNLMSYAGVDPTGVASSSAAISAWLAASLATGAPAYAPAGKYLDQGRIIDLAPQWGNGIKIYGDGEQQTIFYLSGGTWQFWSSGASGGGGAVFYLKMEDFGLSTTGAHCLQLGDNNYASALNGCSFRDMWFDVGLASSGGYAGILCNEVYSCDFANLTVNSGGYSATSGTASLRLTQASFNRFQGSFSGTNYGVHLTSQPMIALIASFTGSISGGVLTVTGTVTYPNGMPSGGLLGLFPNTAPTGGVTAFTYVSQQLTGTTGQAGTYQLANSAGYSIANAGSQSLVCTNELANFTGTINASAVLTISAAPTWLITAPSVGLLGENIQTATGLALPNGTYVLSQLTGPTGGAGTYQLACATGGTIPTLATSTAFVSFTTGYSFGNTFHNLDCEVTGCSVQIDTQNANQNTWTGGEFNVGPYGAGPGNIINCLAGSGNVFISLRPDLASGSTNLVGAVIPNHTPSIGTPTFPASGIPYTNTQAFDIDVYLFGPFTQVALSIGSGGPIDLGATGGTQFAHLNLPSGYTLTLTYTGSCSWLFLPRATY